MSAQLAFDQVRSGCVERQCVIPKIGNRAAISERFGQSPGSGRFGSKLQNVLDGPILNSSHEGTHSKSNSCVHSRIAKVGCIGQRPTQSGRLQHADNSGVTASFGRGDSRFCVRCADHSAARMAGGVMVARTASSSAGSTGLVKNPSIPASRQALRPVSSASAVSAKIGTGFSPFGGFRAADV